MIRRWQKYLNMVNRLSDVVLIMASLLAAVYIWLFQVRGDPSNIAASIVSSGWLSFAYALILVLIYQLTGVYDSLRRRPVRRDVMLVVLDNTVGLIALGAFLFVFRLEDFSRGVLAVFYILSSLLIIGKRLLMRVILNHYRSRGYNQKHLILIGGNELSAQFVNTLREHPRYGFTIHGYIGRPGAIPDERWLGEMDRLVEILEQHSVDEVVAALAYDEISLLPVIIATTERNGTKVSIIPYFADYIPASASMEVIGESKLLNVRTTPLDFPANAMVKRAGDIIGSLCLIVLTSPLMLLAAIGTKLSSPGPVIFRQTRIGLHKKPFTMYKFRSMRVNEDENTAWTKNDDPRKTKFGAFIRKTSIDELPQFFNVLKGEMSLVGPRPEIPHFVDQFRETIPLYMLKHLVRPGITGWAQVNGYRGDTAIEPRIRHDIWYIENWSFLLDVKILLLTVFGGMLNKEKVG